MKKNQQGFSIVEVLIIVLVVGVLGLAGWLVLQKDSKKPDSATNTQKITATKTYTDTAKLYTIKYPADWTVKEAADCCDGSPKDYTQIPKAVDFIPPNTPGGRVGYGIVVQADKTDALAEEVRRSWQANKHTPEDKTINGYAAQHLDMEFKADAESYTDHHYLITHNGASVFMTFREKYYHQSPAENWNASKYMDEFNSSVNSIKFLN